VQCGGTFALGVESRSTAPLITLVGTMKLVCVKPTARSCGVCCDSPFGVTCGCNLSLLPVQRSTATRAVRAWACLLLFLCSVYMGTCCSDGL
jgi:hypothetical protein